MKSYLVRLRSVYFPVHGSSATLAFMRARRIHGPDLQLVDFEAIEDTESDSQPVNVIPINVKNRQSFACQECLIYLSKCYCVDEG